MKKNRNIFDSFVREALAIGFTDIQIEFLWDWLYIVASDPDSITHEEEIRLESIINKK